ncbi:MAG: patatin-like phospholipase family protein, partial [Clostridia bacterium]|nr:patatin-like phospholipase family protein [Clostridia bacterium]
MTKTGLVLEGGGLRGMYTAGVLDAFLERNIKFDYGIGVSAGAAYGISYISKQKGRNLEVCEKYINDKRYVSIANLIKERALFGQKFVYEEIPLRLVPFDYNTYFNSSCVFFTGVTNVSTGRSEYFKLKDDKYKFNLFSAVVLEHHMVLKYKLCFILQKSLQIYKSIILDIS